MKNTLIGVAILTLVSLPTSAGMLGMDWEATGEYNVDTEVSTLKAEDGIRVWTNIEENVRKRMKEGKSAIPEEMSIWQMVNASFLTVTDKKLREINKHINNIPFMKLADQASSNNMSEGDYKRMLIEQNIQARNDLLESVINTLADMDVEYIFENIIGGKTYVSPNQRDKKN